MIKEYDEKTYYLIKLPYENMYRCHLNLKFDTSVCCITEMNELREPTWNLRRNLDFSRSRKNIYDWHSSHEAGFYGSLKHIDTRICSHLSFCSRLNLVFQWLAHENYNWWNFNIWLFKLKIVFIRQTYYSPYSHINNLRFLFECWL